MVSAGYLEEAEVGSNADWIQEVYIPVSSGPFLVTPASGKLTIHFRDKDGVLWHWNGSAFVASTYFILSTTIVGQESRYSFTVPQSAVGQTLRFEGWINDDKTTLDKVDVKVRRTQAARLSFNGNDP